VWVVPSDRDRTYFRQNCSQEFLAGYLAAYRVEFRGQPGRSCGPWWRSSCRLWPRPSTWSRVECAWSTAPSRRAGPMPRTTSCGAASTAPPGSTPNWSACSTRRHLHLRPAAGMHPRCERHLATTPVAEIVAHSGGGSWIKAQRHQRWRSDLLCAATERGTLRTSLCAATHARPTLARWRGDRGHRLGRTQQCCF
jgi:hypothetical protein